MPIIMIASILVGCTNQNIVLTVNNKKVSESLYRIYLWTTQQQFESLTPNIWDMELEGKRTEEIAKDTALKSIVLAVAAEEKAKELDIKLTKEEKKENKQKAKDIINTREDLSKIQGFTQEDVEKFFDYGLIIEKVLNKISENYKPNEEEIKKQMEQTKRKYEKVTLQQVLIPTKGEDGQKIPSMQLKEAKAIANEVLKRALKGEKMETLVAKYSQDTATKDTQGKFTVGHDEIPIELEEVAFTTSDNVLIPYVIETEKGYHIVKVLSHEYGTEEEIRKDSEKDIKLQFAQTELTEISQALKVEKSESYESIHIVREEAKTDSTIKE